MDVELLQDLGLGKNEAKVYLALIDLGPSATGVIVERSHVPSSKVYLVLKTLMQLGFVSYALQKRKKLFRATDPNKLSDLLDVQKKNLAEREKKLLTVIARLKQKQQIAETLHKPTTLLQVFEGAEGIKAARELVLEVLNDGDEFLVLGAPKLIRNERLRGYFNEFHERRAKKGIKYRAIYDSDARKQGTERKKSPLTQIRYGEEKTQSVLWIFSDYIAHVILAEEPTTVLIKNEQIAGSAKSYFEIIWSHCKE